MHQSKTFTIQAVYFNAIHDASTLRKSLSLSVSLKRFRNRWFLVLLDICLSCFVHAKALSINRKNRYRFSIFDYFSIALCYTLTALRKAKKKRVYLLEKIVSGSRSFLFEESGPKKSLFKPINISTAKISMLLVYWRTSMEPTNLTKRAAHLEELVKKQPQKLSSIANSASVIAYLICFEEPNSLKNNVLNELVQPSSYKLKAVSVCATWRHSFLERHKFSMGINGP